jgi:hypothetical protein
MTVHTELSPTEAADRLALRELFDAYAHCADRRDAEGQKALFTEDTRFAVYMDGEGSEPTYVLEGREALTPVFDDLNRYEVTTHFNGQSTVTIDGNRATGESYTIANHVFSEDGDRKIMIASLRYLDTFTKNDRRWYFAERDARRQRASRFIDLRAQRAQRLRCRRSCWRDRRSPSHPQATLTAAPRSARGGSDRRRHSRRCR